jgi:hypothetical protein
VKFTLADGAPASGFTSWADYLERTAEAERLAWCARKAKTANRKRSPSETAAKLTAGDVWSVLEKARGRCVYCNSLALEPRPSGVDGRPLPWDAVGRRIGSLEHLVMRVSGGLNAVENLAWSCLWCNDYVQYRIWGATDHGGLQAEAAG